MLVLCKPDSYLFKNVDELPILVVDLKLSTIRVLGGPKTNPAKYIYIYKYRSIYLPTYLSLSCILAFADHKIGIC